LRPRLEMFAHGKIVSRTFEIGRTQRRVRCRRRTWNATVAGRVRRIDRQQSAKVVVIP
jgi:hypothetical protein